jgi:hypothetical protein
MSDATRSLSTPHEVNGPDGKRLASITSRGEFIRVAVPEGSAGQVWSFTKLCLGRLWFFNLPNYLAASSDALLVPHDVAAKDGLPVLHKPAAQLP